MKTWRKPWYVIKTPCYPKEWKVTSDKHVQDNGTENYFLTQAEAQLEANKRNAP
jgi:hypothetical protein